MKKPDFFIVGAPKCGTTSIAGWLREHPQVFFPPPSLKEPHYFNTDTKQYISSLADYEAIFRNVQCYHQVAGEGSVRYLSSRVAISNILEYQPAARLIVCLRNPVEMFQSLHHDSVFMRREPEADIRKVWMRVKNGESPPVTFHGHPSYIDYAHACSLGQQVWALLNQIDRSAVHFMFLEDIAARPRFEYADLLKFLGVGDDGRTCFDVRNQAKKRRMNSLSWLTYNIARLNKYLKLRSSMRLVQRMEQWNTSPVSKPVLTDDLQSEITMYFKADIELLAQLTETDLSHWLV